MSLEPVNMQPEQQSVPADQALVMAIERVKNAEAELDAATTNLYALSAQVTAQVVQANNKQLMDKIESLESPSKNEKETAK